MTGKVTQLAADLTGGTNRQASVSTFRITCECPQLSCDEFAFVLPRVCVCVCTNIVSANVTCQHKKGFVERKKKTIHLSCVYGQTSNQDT